MAPNPKLTPKMTMFVAEYLANGLDAKKAAIAAGYSAKTAESQGCQLLKHPKVSAEIAKVHGKRLAKLDITAEKVLQELALMGFANMQDYLAIDEQGRLTEFDYSKLTREQAAAIQEITVDTTGGAGDGERKLVLRTKMKLAPKRDSLELLGKHLKLFTDRVEISMGPEIIEKLVAGRKRAAAK